VRIVVSGTGTDVGKTWVSAALVARLQVLGRRSFALKPIESGGNADAMTLAQASGSVLYDAPYCFEAAVGPHLAAQRAGVAIDLETCVSWTERSALAFGAEDVVVELAGGLFSPLTDRHTNADLLRMLCPDKWITVAPDRLGVLHDLKALLFCAQQLGHEPPTVVLNDPDRPDASTGTNEASLHWAGTCSPAARFRRGPHAVAHNEDALARLLCALCLT